MIFSLSFPCPVLHLASLVSWVDGGRTAIGAPILISFFIVLSGFSFRCCISDTVHWWVGETFAFLACLGPWVVWRLQLLHTYFGAGVGSAFRARKRTRVQSVVLMSIVGSGCRFGSVLFGQVAGVLME